MSWQRRKSTKSIKYKRVSWNITRYLVIVITLLLVLLPLVWTASVSIKGEGETYDPSAWIPKNPNLRNYHDIFFLQSYGRYYLNTVIVAMSATAIVMLLGTLGAYSLARFRFPKKIGEYLLFWILATRMLPPILAAFPLFVVMKELRLLNNYLSIIIGYTLVNLPLAVWLMRVFILEVPQDLEEAAMIDGSSRMGALVRITLPLVAPGFVATSILCLIESWNGFLYPLIFSQTSRTMTITVGIAAQISEGGIQWGTMAAATITAIIPVIIFTLVAGRQLVRGLTKGAIK